MAEYEPYNQMMREIEAGRALAEAQSREALREHIQHMQRLGRLPRNLRIGPFVIREQTEEGPESASGPKRRRSLPALQLG